MLVVLVVVFVVYITTSFVSNKSPSNSNKIFYLECERGGVFCGVTVQKMRINIWGVVCSGGYISNIGLLIRIGLLLCKLKHENYFTFLRPTA